MPKPNKSVSAALAELRAEVEAIQRERAQLRIDASSAHSLSEELALDLREHVITEKVAAAERAAALAQSEADARTAFAEAIDSAFTRSTTTLADITGEDEEKED